MEHIIDGLHHITAITSNLHITLDFYSRILGLTRLKRNLDFEESTACHLYIENSEEYSGSILTFFPWKGNGSRRLGSGQITEISFLVPLHSLQFWMNRLDQEGIFYTQPMERFGRKFIRFTDPDGLQLELVANDNDNFKFFDAGIHYQESIIPEYYKVQDIYNISWSLRNYKKTSEVLINVFGFKKSFSYQNRYRFQSGPENGALRVDLLNQPNERKGLIAGGSIHHIAFNVPNIETLEILREKVIAMRLNPTPILVRDYFSSIYFRDTSGLLIEVAVNPPDFQINQIFQVVPTHIQQHQSYRDKRREFGYKSPSLWSY